MPRIFELARWPDGYGPIHVTLEAVAAFKQGALVVDADGDGEFDECGADPAAVYGVAKEKAFSHPGNEQANASDVIFTTGGSLNKCAVDKANAPGLVWSGRGVNGGTDPVTPLLTHIGEQYGVLKTAAGEWVIDIAEVTAKVITIIDIDIDNKIFFFQFISTVAVA